MKPIPFLCGLSACVFLTLAWVLYVNHLVNTATIPGDTRHWSERARHEAFGVCYDGCNDCIDVSKIEDACTITASTQLACDARRMWFWADRYPTECLQAVGSLLQEKELKWKRFKLRFLYILAVITVAAGFAAYEAAGRFVEWSKRRRQRRARYRHRDDSGTSPSTPLLRATTISTALISTLLYASAAEAYACTEWHAVHNQPFVSVIDPTLFGNIHGWLSDCYTERYPCGERCDSGKKGSTTCTTAWCSRERPDASPADFVRNAAKMVTRCGFEMVDIVPGIVDRRIANPRIEGSLWVKISVNRFNGSDGVHGQVLCLGDVVTWPSLVTVRGSGIWSRFRLGFQNNSEDEAEPARGPETIAKT